MPTINQGAGGFHLYTVVTDGYGNYIAEDAEGNELARVNSTGETTPDCVRDMTTLANFAGDKLNEQ
jgi:hypothetical protein